MIKPVWGFILKAIPLLATLVGILILKPIRFVFSIARFI